MNLEEAIEKYGILIPENVEDYDKKKYKMFYEMYLESLYTTFNKIEQNQQGRNAIILGGQTGAGKSALAAETKRQFLEKDRSIALIDDDQYRKLYPYGKEILKECPEYYTKITATATGKITPMILKLATDNGYDFIFDGTMKNQRIIKTMQTWNDYKIKVKVMAASRLRSLVGISARNVELRKIGEEGRFITISQHDETYKGIPETLRYLENLNLAQEISVYTRGKDIFSPIKQYSSLEDIKISSATKLEELREMDEKNFLANSKEHINYLEKIKAALSLTEQEEIKKIIIEIQQNFTPNIEGR